jgi:hypothetical protein
MWIIPTPWGPIPVHFCVDELIMLMAFLGMSGGTIAWVRSKFKRHEKQEDAKHAACCKHDEPPVK